MALGRHRRAVGVFSKRRDVESALRELRDSGFPMDRVSVITRDANQQDNEDIAGADVRGDVFDKTKADEGATTGAVAGGALGGLTGLLVGLGTLAIPGIGPIMLAGATATALATTLAGGAIGAVAGSLLGGLIGLGIPEERARAYSDRVSRGHYLVLVEGTDDDIRRAEAILSHRGIEDWGVYDTPQGTTTAGRRYRAIGVFPHHREAEAAIRELHSAGFPMSQISLVGRDTNGTSRAAGGNVTDRTQTDEGAKAGAASGAALGGLGGLLVGLGALAIPGIGPVIAGGTLATALATAAAGGAIGAAAGGIGGALVGLGIPDERARFYNDRVNHGDYLVMVEGTEDEIRRADTILSRRGIQHWGVFDAPDDDRHRTGATAGTARPGAGRRHRAVGVFSHRRDAEAALRELRDAGFDMDRVSVVGKDIRQDEIAGADVHNRATGNKADEGAKGGAAAGAALGGLGGLLVGLGALAIPGIGPVIAGGALATALATTAAGGAIGAAAGGLTGALVGLGIPEERARHYNDRVNRGDYLVMVDGTEEELHRAQAILSRHRIQDWGIYDTGDVTPERTHHDTQHVDRTGAAYAAPSSPRGSLVHNKRAVGVFSHRREAEAAIQELNQAGFPMSQVSLVGKDIDGGDRVAGGNIADRTQTDEGAKTGAAGGAALGGLGGLLVGLGALAIPGIGPVIAGGALATALATAAAGGAIGAAAGGLTGALVGLGIPDDRARSYNDRVNRGEYLVMVDGTEDEIRRAEAILRRRGIQDWDVFDAPDSDRDRTGYATRQVIEPNTTPGVTTTDQDVKVVSGEPEVIIIDHRDRRDQTL
jgi:uncharacterized membrane protein